MTIIDTGAHPAESDVAMTAGPADTPPEYRSLIDEAKKRYDRALTYTADARKLILDDLKFANADSDNGYQWPNDIKKNRDVDARPSLTINQVRQHNLQIINDAKKNKPGIVFRPTGNGATYESAQALNALVRHIEYRSQATVAYDTATSFQVDCGLGWLRVVTGYKDSVSFNQEILIKRVIDPLSILMDPDAQEADRSDALFCFIFEDLNRSEAEKKYPKYKHLMGTAALGSDDGWLGPDKVRICEYYRKVEETDTLYARTDPQSGKLQLIKGSLLPASLRAELDKDESVRKRDTTKPVIEWYLIIGNTPAESDIFPGEYIPVVPVIGQEVIIDGRYDCKGHTRNLKDPQRMYNYWCSAGVEQVALQSKTPFIASAEAIEEYEDMWNTANRANYSVLIYNGISDDGTPIAPPQRAPMPTLAPAYLQGMQQSHQELMFVSGQYQAEMGAPSNERSGKAINQRQRQGDTATYHFIDNLAIAIRHVGRIILGLIPIIYDTQQLINVLAEDGVSYEVMIDPAAKQAWQGEQLKNKLVGQRVLNPKVGEYDVQADIGPSFGTKREEAFDALTLILTQAPQLTSICGDLLLKAGDFYLGDEAADRLRRMVPPQALGQGPSQQEQMLMQQLQAAKTLIAKLMQGGAEDKLKILGKDQMRDIDAYKAETDRLKILMGQMQHTETIQAQLLSEIMNTDISQVVASNEPVLAAAAGTAAPQVAPLFQPRNPPGARMGPNGQLYMRNFAASPEFTPVGAPGMG
jgi:Phage P22-like portal protein